MVDASLSPVELVPGGEYRAWVMGRDAEQISLGMKIDDDNWFIYRGSPPG